MDIEILCKPTDTNEQHRSRRSVVDVDNIIIACPVAHRLLVSTNSVLENHGALLLQLLLDFGDLEPA